MLHMLYMFFTLGSVTVESSTESAPPSASHCTPGSIADDFPMLFFNLSVTFPITLSSPCGKASLESRASSGKRAEICSLRP